jgi:hypothetical protein
MRIVFLCILYFFLAQAITINLSVPVILYIYQQEKPNSLHFSGGACPQEPPWLDSPITNCFRRHCTSCYKPPLFNMSHPLVLYAWDHVHKNLSFDEKDRDILL